jgi:medium-chain acyl-[acyl-carrier-protein] hydrolase
VEIWTETTTVRACETDLNEHWKPSCFFQQMQQAATNHAVHLGFDFHALQAAGRVWILSRLRIHFTDLPVLDEAVSIRTWPKGIGQKLFFLRDFEFHGRDGRPLAVATSAWVLIDPVARRLLRPQALDGHVPDNDGLTALAGPLGKIAVPEDLPERITVQAGYSSVDMLGHVNNARYVEWVCDSVPLDLHRTSRLRELQVNYLNEVRPGERISLRAGRVDGEWLVYGQNLDTGQRACEALVTFA